MSPGIASQLSLQGSGTVTRSSNERAMPSVNTQARNFLGLVAGSRLAAMPSVYVADSLLGAGGAGRVYSATHQPSGRRVALKTLRSREDRSNTFGLLMREAAAVAQLHHPNIVELIDAVVHGERPYLVLELVEGSSVRDWLFEWPGWNTVLAALTEL